MPSWPPRPRHRNSARVPGFRPSTHSCPGSSNWRLAIPAVHSTPTRPSGTMSRIFSGTLPVGFPREEGGERCGCWSVVAGTTAATKPPDLVSDQHASHTPHLEAIMPPLFAGYYSGAFAFIVNECFRPQFLAPASISSLPNQPPRVRRERKLEAVC